MTSTCGQGLAHHSAFPDLVANVLAAVAENLNVHLGAIDVHDEGSRPEHDAYVDLVREHRDLSDRLRALAGKMAACVDLPMASHDPAALASERARRSFEHFVTSERNLVELLHGWIDVHQEMIDALH